MIKPSFLRKMHWVGLTLIILGLGSMLIQSSFYGYVDEAGVLHDSLFLPLAFLFWAAGIVTYLLVGVIAFLRRKRAAEV